METPIAYQVITDRITKLLEAGTVPWKKPWAGADFPKNLVSGKEYSGVNVWMLHASEFGSPYWLTFKQAQALGGSVRKGERGTPIVFTKTLPTKTAMIDTEHGPQEMTDLKSGGRMLKYYTAFNADQCDGIEFPQDGERYQHDPIASAEAIASGYANAPRIEHRGGRACYRPSEDVVFMPERDRFTGAPEYYSTLFHELAHSTGHKSRLARLPERIDFGSDPYGREELVAEMTSAYLCGKAGIENSTLENSAAYIAGWLEAIKTDARLLVSAASAAQKAANLILEGRAK